MSPSPLSFSDRGGILHSDQDWLIDICKFGVRGYISFSILEAYSV